MLKRIFTSKLFYLIMLFLINFSVLICVCVVTVQPLDVGTEYQPSDIENNILPTTSTRYLIKEKNFQTYDSYFANIIEKETMYDSYFLDTIVINIGSEIKKGDLVGTLDGENVFSKFDAFCLNIIETEDNFEVILYNYDQFTVEMNLSNSEYYSFKPTNKDIYLKYDNIYIELTFVGYDYSVFATENIIKLKFSTTNCNYLVNSNVNCTIEVKKTQYLNQLYLPASIFDYETFQKKFYIVINDNIYQLYVEAFIIIDEYALITSSSYNLQKGMYLYLYE